MKSCIALTGRGHLEQRTQHLPVSWAPGQLVALATIEIGPFSGFFLLVGLIVGNFSFFSAELLDSSHQCHELANAGVFSPASSFSCSIRHSLALARKRLSFGDSDCGARVSKGRSGVAPEGSHDNSSRCAAIGRVGPSKPWSGIACALVLVQSILFWDQWLEFEQQDPRPGTTASSTSGSFIRLVALSCFFSSLLLALEAAAFVRLRIAQPKMFRPYEMRGWCLFGLGLPGVLLLGAVIWSCWKVLTMSPSVNGVGGDPATGGESGEDVGRAGVLEPSEGSFPFAFFFGIGRSLDHHGASLVPLFFLLVGLLIALCCKTRFGEHFLSVYSDSIPVLNVTIPRGLSIVCENSDRRLVATKHFRKGELIYQTRALIAEVDRYIMRAVYLERSCDPHDVSWGPHDGKRGSVEKPSGLLLDKSKPSRARSSQEQQQQQNGSSLRDQHGGGDLGASSSFSGGRGEEDQEPGPGPASRVTYIEFLLDTQNSVNCLNDSLGSGCRAGSAGQQTAAVGSAADCTSQSSAGAPAVAGSRSIFPPAPPTAPTDHLHSLPAPTSSQKRQLHTFDSCMNHCCDATAVCIDTRITPSAVYYSTFARRDIAPGSDVTEDYNTFDYDYDADPGERIPHCRCQNERCRGAVLGFKYLGSLQQQADLYPDCVAAVQELFRREQWERVRVVDLTEGCSRGQDLFVSGGSSRSCGGRRGPSSAESGLLGREQLLLRRSASGASAVTRSRSTFRSGQTMISDRSIGPVGQLLRASTWGVSSFGKNDQKSLWESRREGRRASRASRRAAGGAEFSTEENVKLLVDLELVSDDFLMAMRTLGSASSTKSAAKGEAASHRTPLLKRTVVITANGSGGRQQSSSSDLRNSSAKFSQKISFIPLSRPPSRSPSSPRGPALNMFQLFLAPTASPVHPGTRVFSEKLLPVSEAVQRDPEFAVAPPEAGPDANAASGRQSVEHVLVQIWMRSMLIHREELETGAAFAFGFEEMGGSGCKARIRRFLGLACFQRGDLMPVGEGGSLSVPNCRCVLSVSDERATLVATRVIEPGAPLVVEHVMEQVSAHQDQGWRK